MVTNFRLKGSSYRIEIRGSMSVIYKDGKAIRTESKEFGEMISAAWSNGYNCAWYENAQARHDSMELSWSRNPESMGK